MTPKKNTVQKMLSPEETSLLQDVMAGLNVLLGSNNAGAVEETTEASGAQAVEMGAEPTPEELANKGNAEEMETNEVDKSNDGPTANDKAETRLEDGTVVTEANLGAVAKMLASLGVKAPVQKSQSSVDANSVAQIVLKALEPVIGKIVAVEKDMNNMLEALGFSDAMDTVEKAQNPLETIQKSTQSYSNTPVVNPDAGGMIELLSKSIAQQLIKEETPVNEGPRPNYSTSNSRAHKALGEAVQNVHRGV